MATTLMDAVQDENYIYAVGSQATIGLNSADGLLLKIAKSDVSLSIKKIYGDGNVYAQVYNGVYSDGTYLYAVGSSNSKALITKFNLSDFSVVASKTYDNVSYTDGFESVYADGSNIYAVGTKADSYNNRGLVVKFNTDLTINTAKEIYFSGKLVGFNTLQSVGSDLYIFGTKSDRWSDYTGLMVKVAKSDLAISASKTLETSPSNLIFYGSYLYGSDIYASGITINKFSSLPSGNFNTTPSGYTWNDISLTSAASDLTLADTSFTMSDSNETYRDSWNSLTTPATNLTTYSISN
jgi:hypothetical protein